MVANVPVDVLPASLIADGTFSKIVAGRYGEPTGWEMNLNKPHVVGTFIPRSS